MTKATDSTKTDATKADDAKVAKQKEQEKKIPLDTATTDRSPGKQGQFGEKPPTTVCPTCGK